MLERPSEVTWTGHTVCDSKNLTQRESGLCPGAWLGPQGKKGGKKQEKQKHASIKRLRCARH